jgi:hypothetical protein
VKRPLGPRLIAHERTHRARGRATGWLDGEHVGAERAQYVAADEPTLVGEIEDAVGREHGRCSSGALGPRSRPPRDVLTYDFEKILL